MSIGPDVKEVLQELGTPITIIKPNGDTTTGEKFDFEHYHEVSTEFVRQFCYSGDFQYDTVCAEGDILTFDTTALLVMNLKRNYFEGEVVDVNCFLVECNNKNGKFARQTKSRDANGEPTVNWTNVLHTGVYAVLAEVEPKDDEEAGMTFSNSRFALYTPYQSDVRIGDRWYPDATDNTEYYQIEELSKYRFANILYCMLVEDSRE